MAGSTAASGVITPPVRRRYLDWLRGLAVVITIELTFTLR